MIVVTAPGECPVKWYSSPHESLAEARHATLHMEGGAMGGMHEARMGGRGALDCRDENLVPANLRIGTDTLELFCTVQVRSYIRLPIP